MLLQIQGMSQGMPYPCHNSVSVRITAYGVFGASGVVDSNVVFVAVQYFAMCVWRMVLVHVCPHQSICMCKRSRQLDMAHTA